MTLIRLNKTLDKQLLDISSWFGKYAYHINKSNNGCNVTAELEPDFHEIITSFRFLD